MYAKIDETPMFTNQVYKSLTDGNVNSVKKFGEFVKPKLKKSR